MGSGGGGVEVNRYKSFSFFFFPPLSLGKADMQDHIMFGEGTRKSWLLSSSARF